MPITYSNPRMSAAFTDWPYGTMRTLCTFEVESAGARGQRAIRTTVNPKTGLQTAPKKLTYARKVRIVEGDDGKTYIANLSAYGFVSIMQSNMQFLQESIHPGDDRYPAALALFDN